MKIKNLLKKTIIINTFLYLQYLINNIQLNKKTYKIDKNIHNSLINKNKKKNENEIINNLINQLNHDYIKRKPKYILLSDYFINKYCNDINSYIIFEYFRKNNNSNAYYIINEESLLYQSLLEKNQTNNLIPINPSTNYWDKLYNFILNSKIIVQSYTFFDFRKLISKVDYLKYLKINHGVRYFKKRLAEDELKNINISKYHSIITSPYEYNIYKNKFHLKDTHFFKAGLPRYDRFQNINKNKSENQCILIAFTYRRYDNEVYKKSLFKKNLEKLLKEEELISFLEKNKIDLIYIPHHYDILRKRQFDANNFHYIKYKTQKDLSHFVEQCSLCVTDFSSISFDFMFQNKPTLFYLIDLNDKNEFFERQYMRKNETIYFGNVFTEQQSLIEKIKYYINNKFIIDSELKSNYESLFYYKKNITQRIVKIIYEIIKEK
jgi:CDP-glycerol glycerophosphotransferase (TagB/SpsB family)